LQCVVFCVLLVLRKMGNMSAKPNLKSLKRHRSLINASFERFQTFWHTRGKIATIDTICAWAEKCSPLIDDYISIQEEIHTFYIREYEEEHAHISLTESFEEIYYELMYKIQECIDFYKFPKATRY
jgi:hypothetical protein